ncbi:MAG: rhodanese-like domain-containing protein [Sandaracinaceae bacterium]
MLQNLLTAVVVAVCAFVILRLVVAYRARVSSAEARRLVQDGALLIDVRTAHEVANGCLPRAKNIPVQSLAARIGELDASRPVVVYCASGIRSARAVGVLKKAGFDAHDLGPLSAW